MNASCPLIVLLTLSLCLQAYSQPLRFKRYTIDDGLSQSSVKSVVQDHKGFIWLATQDGLNRFDSQGFEAWKRSKSRASLYDNHIHHIIEVGRHLWIASQGGINVYDSDIDSMSSVKPSSDLTGNSIYTLLTTSSGEIWGGGDNGIVVVDTVRLAINHTLSDFLIIAPGVVSMIEDHTHQVWVATRHDGVYVFDGATKKRRGHISKQALGLSSDHVDPVRHLYCDKDGRIWIATNKGLFQCDSDVNVLNLRKVKLRTLHHDFTSDIIMCSMTDHTGKVWVGTQNGVLRQNEGDSLYSHYTHNESNPYSLSDRVILCLYQDSHHVIWIGTYNGVNKLVYGPPAFQSYLADVSDRSKNLQVVRSLYTDDDVNIYVGTVNALCLFDRNTETLQNIKDPNGNNLQNVFCVMRDREGQLWCGNSNGFQQIKKTREGFRAEDAADFPELSVFRNSEVTQCLQLTNNTFLLSTFNENGLYIWSRSSHSVRNLKSSSARNSLANNKINHLYKSAHGTVWIATNQGISSYDPLHDHFTNFYPTGKNSSDRGLQVVNTITQLNGVLWLATNGGLIRYDPAKKHSRVFTEEDGLANQNLYCAIPSDDSTLWMSSNRGISKFNLNTSEFYNYDVTDGLQSNEYNRFAWFRSVAGTLYFGGMQGFDVFMNTNTKMQHHPVAITGIRIIDENKFIDRYPKATPLELHHSQNALGFTYTTLDFGSPKRRNYWCKLDGLDREWINNGSNRTISYTNLSPGSYVFRVRTDEGHTDMEAKYAFTIAAPYWQTPWFIVTTIIMGLFIVGYVVQSYYNRKLEKQQTIFEKKQAIEHERTRIATDMHDDLGAGLSRIKFLSESIQVKSREEQPIEDDIEKIKGYSHEMIDKMGEIVWALDKKNDSLLDLLSYIRSYTVEYLAQNNITCFVSEPDEVPPLFVSGDFRRNVFLTVKEALHNIVKHADTDEVTFEITANDNLSIVIRDYGKGFENKNVRPFSNGLSNMHRRMDEVGGKLLIENTSGTTIRLELPMV